MVAFRLLFLFAILFRGIDCANSQTDPYASSDIASAVSGPWYTTKPFLQFHPPGATPGVNEWLLPSGSGGPNNETTTFEFAKLEQAGTTGLELRSLSQLITLGPTTMLFTTVMDYTELILQLSPTREPSTITNGTYMAHCSFSSPSVAVCDMDKELRHLYMTASEGNDWYPTMTVLGEVNTAQVTSTVAATSTADAVELTAWVDAVVVVALAAVVAV